MLRYKNVPSLEFDLQNGYQLKVDFPINDDGTYHLKGFLRRNDVELWSSVSKLEINSFIAERDKVKNEIAKYISSISNNGYLKEYIDNYEYELLCFNKGNEIMEKNFLK